MTIQRTPALLVLALALLPTGAVLAQTQQPPQTIETEQAQLLREEKANQLKAKSDKAQRKALKQQNKANKAAENTHSAPPRS